MFLTDRGVQQGYLQGVARLCAVLIHTAAVEHENVGNITWNYTTLPQYIPSIVPKDGADRV